MRIKCLAILAPVATCLTVALGGWDNLLQVLITLMILDYITGLLAAWYNRQLNSYTGFKGIIKKVVMLCIVALGVTLDTMLLADQPEWIRTMIIYFFAANEGLSILENTNAAGIPVPLKIREVLKKLEGENGGQ
jgi:toxin secretion/phage lysis holin